MKRAWRSAEKDRMMTFLELVGLAGGLACTILIYLWIADERQMDRFGRNDDRLFQVMQNSPGEKAILTSEQTPGLLAAALTAEMPEVQKSVSVVPVSRSDKQAILSIGDTEIYADAQFAGKDYFNLFAWPLLDGDPDQVLSDRHHLVLSKTLALKIFHRADGLLGKTITCNQQDSATLFTISGVFDNTAKVSSTSFDVVLPYDLFLDKNQKLTDWRNGDPQTFVLLKPGNTVESFNRKLSSFLMQKNPAAKATLFAQNYPDKYLHNHYENGRPSGGRIEYVTLFTVVAFVILFIACVNFMNLATAFADDRMKDAGVKKLMGPGRRSIAWHFLGESLGMCTAALIIALLLVWFSLPAFNVMTSKHLSIQPDIKLLVSIVGVTAITALAAGVYPALYLSGFKPLTAVRGKLKQNSNQQMLRVTENI